MDITFIETTLSAHLIISKIAEKVKNNTLELDDWQLYDEIQNAIQDLAKLSNLIINEFRNPPSERDLSICFKTLNGWKYEEIAQEYNIHKGNVSRIVAKCMPHAAKSLRKYTHNPVSCARNKI